MTGMIGGGGCISHASTPWLGVAPAPVRRGGPGGLKLPVFWQQRRAARLAALGFADLAGYLRRRYLEQGWSIKRMRAELGVGRSWLVAQMARLGLR